jgi:predicted site-specific integrase-resolvase
MDQPRSIPEACKLLMLSRSSLYLQQKAGRIRFVKQRGRSFIMQSEIERYLRWLQRKNGKAA